MNKLIKQAFTLIELLVVIAIIGILSGIIVVSMGGVTQKASIAKNQVFSNSLKNSLMLNLVSEWKLDGDVNDSWGNVDGAWNGSGGGTNVTANYRPASECASGQCLNFDGTDDYINYGASSDYLAGSFTIGVWANSFVKTWHYILGNSLYNVANAFEIYERQDSVGYGVYYDTNLGNPMTIYSGAINQGQWKYITVVYDGSYLKLYIDGTFKIQVARSGTFSGGNLVVGSNGISRYWYGLIDDIRIYNAAMPTSQIKEQYYIGLNKLLSKGEITKEEYSNKIEDLLAAK
jgi:prepilin-type N-terminal cleavage/methylation domain-containing protein